MMYCKIISSFQNNKGLIPNSSWGIALPTASVPRTLFHASRREYCQCIAVVFFVLFIFHLPYLWETCIFNTFKGFLFLNQSTIKLWPWCLRCFPLTSPPVRFQVHVILKSLSSGKYTLKGFFSFKDLRPQKIPPPRFGLSSYANARTAMIVSTCLHKFCNHRLLMLLSHWQHFQPSRTEDFKRIMPLLCQLN